MKKKTVVFWLLR